MAYVVSNRPSLLGALIGANMNTTADQSVGINFSKYVLRYVVVTNASVNLTTAAGGIYDAASKGGNALVANTQIYTALTASTKFVDLTLAAIATTDVSTATTLYVALTTGQGSAATADFYFYGHPLV
jgi:hypothetical protein